jgi:cyclophilin family peptidyl-prolyl cis-trans isomerase
LRDCLTHCSRRSAAQMPDRMFRGIGYAVVLAFTLASSRADGQARVLDSASVRIWASVLRAHDLRNQDTTAIDDALRSPVAPLRAVAARVVGMNRITARYASLRTMLRDERDSATAADAAFALGLATDSLSCDALRDALARPATGVAAAWALGDLGERCGSFARLFERTRTPAVRAMLLRVATKWTTFPDSIVAAAYATATTAGERWSALWAFSRARRSAAAPLALAATHDRDPRIREVAARLLTASLQPPENFTSSVARLDSMLRDTSAHVRIAAVRSIASFKAAALAPLIRTWRHERDANVRVTMAQSVGSVAADTSGVWLAWWASDSTHMVRRSLITSAWQADAIDGLQRAIRDTLATHADFRFRIAMIAGAASKAVESHLRDITARLHDSDPRVRAAAVSALAGTGAAARASIGWSSIRDSAALDADVGVRQAALDALVADAGAKDVAIAMDGYARAETDTSGDARESALMVVASAWRRDSIAFADSIRERLQHLTPSADPLLRARVLSVTPLVHWRSAPAAEPPLAEYERIVREVVAPSLTGRVPRLVIATNRGAVRIVLDGVRTPMTVDHLLRLAKSGYFHALRFHRVVPAFVAQGGDPRGDGSGGPGYAIRDELNRSPYVRGAVGMALSGPDTGGSQFFLTLAPQPHLDGHYTVFGHVSAGLAAMDQLLQGDAILNISTVPQ